MCVLSQRLAVLWCKVGDSAMVCVTVDACLALSCKMLEMSLSFDSLLNCISNTAGSLKVNNLNYMIHTFCELIFFHHFLLDESL